MRVEDKDWSFKARGFLVNQHSTVANSKNFETFGNYLFLKRLAVGGMAEVFLARPTSHVGNGRVQVIKRILPHVANNLMFLQMFQTEIQVIMGFNHPQIVQLHDFGEINSQPYISMEYIEGKNLKEVISKFIDSNEKMSIPMALSLVAQGASGLNYAHTFVNKVTGATVNAIHRDISPHNLILSYEGNLKVIDFGIAKAASGFQEPTRVGTIKGKTAYLSPEQVSGFPVDARSDIFALGIVAWELLTLKRPFHKDGDSEVTIIGRIDNCDQHIQPPSAFNSEVPSEIDHVVMKALRKNPNERYATAGEFQSTLRQVMLKFYPNFSYSDTGKVVRTLFASEIENERRDLQLLNTEAQKRISSRLDERTVVMDQSNPGVVTGVMNNLRSIVPGMDQVDVRLMKIESLMKQKASGRHYIMLLFYVFSLVAMKLEDKYSVFNMLFPQKEVTVSSNFRARARTAQSQQKRMAANAPTQKYQPQQKKKSATKY